MTMLNKPTRTLLLLLLCTLLIVPTACADMGPKPSVTITVTNHPGGTLYLDLLHQPDGELGDSGFSPVGYDAGVVDQLRALEGDGWVLAYVTQTSGPPLWGDISPKSDGTYQFTYFGLPDTFRIAAATADSAQVSDTAYTRTRYFTNLVYDWETNTLTEATPDGLYFAALLLTTLIPTLLIEGILLLLFKFRTRRTWLVYLLTNLVTQLGLHLFCQSAIISGSNALLYVMQLFVPELVILLVEAAVYTKLLSERTSARRVAYAFTANAASFILGYFPLHLLLTQLRQL